MQEHRIAQLADTVQGVQRGMAEIVATADSPDGLITVTVGARGELLELELNPRIYRDPDSRTLAADITDTIHRAVQLAQQQVFDLVRTFLPAGAKRAEVDLDFDPFLHQLETARHSGRSWAP